jgi:cytochrome c
MNRFRCACALAATFVALLPFLARADEALAAKRNCLSCHRIERKVVGPAYKDIAARYTSAKFAGQDVQSLLAQKIIKGGAGAWGVVPMPANPQVSEAESRKLAAWILTAKAP